MALTNLVNYHMPSTKIVFVTMDTLFGLYFSLKLALETRSKLLWRFTALTTPTHLQPFDGQGSPNSKCPSWLKLPTVSTRNGACTRGVEWFLHPFEPTRSCQPRPLYSQPRQLPCVQCVVSMTTHLHLSLPFASAKPILKMDCSNC